MKKNNYLNKIKKKYNYIKINIQNILYHLNTFRIKVNKLTRCYNLMRI